MDELLSTNSVERCPTCEIVVYWYLLKTGAETLEDLPHVSTLLHGDDTQVILLIDPDQEGLVVVVPRQIGSMSTKHTATLIGKAEIVSFGIGADVSYQIPLPSGQSRAMPAQVSRGETGLSNRK